jgi:hypothetical protein
MNSKILGVIMAIGLMGAPACDSRSEHGERSAELQQEPSATTNRVDIPESVRRNLGVTFARVESRAVSHTLRVPGRFELLPTARREYRTPLGGTVEVLVAQYERVDVGTPLYRVESPQWRELIEQIEAMRARVESMVPLREAHDVHERSLADKVRLWEERLEQLAELKAAGGGSAAQYTEARATLNATQAELADVMEKDAELQAQQKAAEAELRALLARGQLLLKTAGRPAGSRAPAEPEETDAASPFTVHALAPGVVESLGLSTGGLAEATQLIVTVVQPDQIRFRARGLQADLGRLRDGLSAAIVPIADSAGQPPYSMKGSLKIGLSADADERTIDLLVMPDSLAPWARAGVSAHLEVTLAGGVTEMAVPLSAIVRDGLKPVLFRRDPSDPDKAARIEADLGLSDGRWVVVHSGVKEGDEVVLDGVYQLMLATSGNTAKGGHFHPDGTFHGEDH